MRAKIIADISIIVTLVIFYYWWVSNVPFSHPTPTGLTLSQSMAGIVTIFLFWIGALTLVMLMIVWIHKGK